MAKCQIYPNEEAIWAFQPFGPMDDNIGWMLFLGSHYRGFPVIKIGDTAHDHINEGKRVEFTYKGIKYVAVNGRVMTADEYLVSQRRR